jgi:hypothetical protein
MTKVNVTMFHYFFDKYLNLYEFGVPESFAIDELVLSLLGCMVRVSENSFVLSLIF